MEKPKIGTRAEYRHHSKISTRWLDNDIYGHVNNVVYYSFFDTAVNTALIEAGVLDIHNGNIIGLVVETQCRYFAPLAYPHPVHTAIRVAHLGRSSVRYELALFRENEDSAAAEGHFIHVYVDRRTRRPVALPENLRGFLETLRV